VGGSDRELIRGTMLILACRKLRKQSKSVSQDSTNGDQVLNPGRPANDAGVYKPTGLHATTHELSSQGSQNGVMFVLIMSKLEKKSLLL
jgi:hypothetical protein